MNTLDEYLHPLRFPNASGKMHAIIGHIIGADWMPEDVLADDEQFTVTADGYVTSIGVFWGTYDDFERNVKGYVEAADMPDALAADFWRRYARKVDLTWMTS